VLSAYELGAVDFLFKPIVPKMLRAKASVFVSLRRSQLEEQERRLDEERRQWETDSLRRRIEEEQATAETLRWNAEDLTNAISLNQAMNNVGRIIGPAAAGITIGLLGIAPCFFINAMSFGAVIVALLMMRSSELHVSAPQPRKKGQVREGVRVVAASPELSALLVMAAVFFGLAWMSDVVMPLVAKYTFDGGAGTERTAAGAAKSPTSPSST
jgi:hypothetical protein